MIKIALVDDHQLFLESLVQILKQETQFDLVYYHYNPKIFIDEIKNYEPNIIITDISMPELNGIELIKHLKNILPNVKILVLSSFKIFPSKKLIHGFLSKDTNIIFLSKCIIDIVKNDTKVFDEKITFDEDLLYFNKAILTQKEIEVVKLIALEKTTEDVSNALFISKNTVETHRKNIFFKLNVKNVAGLIVKAEYLGYL